MNTSARTRAGMLLAAGLLLSLPRLSAAAADASALFRVFLKDGATLVSYGEFARIGERVVFSMPLETSEETSAAADPVLHAVTIGSDLVDWDRTNRYAESVRAAHYVATRAESDYTTLSNQVARALNGVAGAADAAQRLAIVQNARQALAEWPRNHYNYRAAEVRQLLGMLDEAIADLRAAAGVRTFALSLTAEAGDGPPLEPLLPPPTLKESIEQALLAARLAASAAERESLLGAALTTLDRAGDALPAEWVRTARVSTQARLQDELRIDRTYRSWSERIVARADLRARAADVRGIERMLVDVRRQDAVLGSKRPDAIAALIAAVEEKLDAARRLRLERDRWAMRLPELRKYWTAMTQPADLFALFAHVKPALEDIRTLAGSPPARLTALNRVMREIVTRASLIAPPDELRSAHALVVSAAQLADNAAAIRREATLSSNLARAWDASSAAAGALMLNARAKSEIELLLRPPGLR